jgi:hypothetical protein
MYKIIAIPVPGGKDNYEVTIPLTWKPLYLRVFRPKMKSKTFLLVPAKIATARLVSKAASILPNDLTGENPVHMSIDGLDTNQGALAKIIALSIQNNGKQPTHSLLRLIEMNLDSVGLREVLFFCIRKLELPEFLNALTLIKGTASILHFTTGEEEAETIPIDTEIAFKEDPNNPANAEA